jgi:hypothetical protein
MSDYDICSGGVTTIGQSFLLDTWDVSCTCGFKVVNLSSRESAHDTVAWHKGGPSALGGDLP